MTTEHGAVLAAILTDPSRVHALDPLDAVILLAEVAAIQATLAARIASQHRTAPAGVPATPATDGDRLLTPDEAAERLSVSRQWLYRHAKGLPFTRKLSRKALRFSEAGLRRWQATRAALKSNGSMAHSAAAPGRKSG